MEFLPLFIYPAVTIGLLLVFYISKCLDGDSRETLYERPQLRKEKKPETYYFILTLVIALSLVIIAPWIAYYITSGAKLNYIDNFIIQIFITSLLVLVTIRQNKSRDSK